MKDTAPILRHIIETVNSGKRIKVKCKKEWETDGPDENMICDIIKIDTHEIDPYNIAEAEILIYMDFMPYLKYNKIFAKPTWYDTLGEPCLTWFETIHWKEHKGIEEFYIMEDQFEEFFDVELSNLFKDYLDSKESKNNISYIEYLENKVMMLASNILKYETNIAMKEDPDPEDYTLINNSSLD
jgi:hypothetical protein